MGQINLNAEAEYAGFRLNKKVLKKSLLSIFSILIAYVAILYHRIYPLELTLSEGFLTQIPLTFWPAVSLLIGISFIIGVMYSSNLIRFASIVSISIIINFEQYLFAIFSGGDSAGEVSRWFSIQHLPRYSIELFDYFQWPLHFTYFGAISKIVSLPLIDMMRLGYVVLYLLFAVGVALFFYVYTSSPLHWMTSSVIYIIFMTVFLNNQLVPQFSALVILVFLFSLGSVSGIKQRFLQFSLYVTLLLLHPFFFIFYILFTALLPFTESLKMQMATEDDDIEVFRSVARMLRTPYSTTSSWLIDGSKKFINDSLIPLIIMTGLHASLFFTRFDIFSEQVIYEIQRPVRTYGSGFVLTRLLTIISESPSASEPKIRLLYHLSSQVVHQVTAYGVITLFVVLLLLSFTMFVRKPVRYLSPIQLSIGFTGFAYYVTGYFLPILGSRAFQVAFLPVGALIAGPNWNSDKLKIIVLIILLASPVIGINSIVNSSIAGGGNTQNYYAIETGEHIADNNLQRGIIMKYPHTGLPPELTEKQDDQIIRTEEFLAYGYRDPYMIMYGPRQEHVTERNFNECNFNPNTRNVVYHNSIYVLTDSRLSDQLDCQTTISN